LARRSRSTLTPAVSAADGYSGLEEREVHPEGGDDGEHREDARPREEHVADEGDGRQHRDVEARHQPWELLAGRVVERGDAGGDDVEHDTGDDLVHPPLHTRPREEAAEDQTAADPREHPDEERPAEGGREEARERGDEHLPLDADVDDAGALADDADEGGQDEWDGVGPRRRVHARGDVARGVVEDVGGDEDHRPDDDRRAVLGEPVPHVSSPSSSTLR
jgi:hypothetical protein